MSYYPTHIADDESSVESHYSEATGPLHADNRTHTHITSNGTPSKSAAAAENANGKNRPWQKRGSEYGLAVQEDFSFDNDDGNENTGAINRQDNGTPARDSQAKVAALIQNERNRRLGVTVAGVDKEDEEETATPAQAVHDRISAPNSGGLLGNIKGWFAGGNVAAEQSEKGFSGTTPRKRDSFLEGGKEVQSPTHSSSRNKSNNNHNNNTSSKSKNNSFHQTTHEEKRLSALTTNDDDDDNSSTSASSTSSHSSSSHHSVDQRTRARRRALRYLSNSCVDAGRKAKTMSYIWGLERLDLKRRRDRYERELGVVEGEMNTDWGGGSAAAGGLGSEGEVDKVEEMARRLVRELPRVSLRKLGSTGGADAGAGSEKGESSKKAYMTMDEYADALQALDPSPTMDWDEDNQPSNLVWTDEKALEMYTGSLQSRLRDAIERTKSLEKRLAVLEKTGDEIVGSLCEDLVDVTSHCNKAEARYVKKGKELERKRRREEVRYRSKIKELEKKVNSLEERILASSGGQSVNVKSLTKYLDCETSDSEDEDDDEGDEENDEIRLEKKLSGIKAKIEQEKAEHEISVQSIQRQCEQSKLRLSVARLVMAGDDNLREYISLLDRFDPTLHQQRRSCSQFGESSYSNDFQEGIPMEALPSPPPSAVTRIRAKLLKAIHLERIYEQRLAVSKAFNDAAINALEHELADREMAGQQMEVRCLNDLMVIDSEIKEIVTKGEQKVNELQKELCELEDAVAVISSKRALVDGKDGAAHDDGKDAVEFQPILESAISTDNDSTSTHSSNVAKEAARVGVTEGDDASSVDKDYLDDSKKSEGNDTALIHLTGSSDINARGPKNASLRDNGSKEESRDQEMLEEMHLGDINPNTPVELHDQSDDKTSIPHNMDQAKAKVKVSFHDSVNIDSTSADEKDLKECVASLKCGASANSLSNPGSDKRKGLLKILGNELKCTLAEYQTSFDISSSSDRVEQLDYMNKVVLRIAEVAGITLSKTEKEEVSVKGWSHPLSEGKKPSKSRSKTKPSKTSAKKKKMKSKKEKETDDGLTETDRLFLASLSEAKFSQQMVDS
ncbi:hypothetical protein HJC23_003614 [Cyclotella cryptica]|uniref:Fibrous sheath-interacting protein 1 n=1 Tax=Cyclotella cryptica TaxID=29204 RepID=A0ABD3QIL5_9STRA|eukprot:CCRYP_004896-RA/>CCRYP_004896-RA protein AED:0.06 eAED:0.06 QI:0/-1/0/1/-1/1/1/0/1071